MRLRIVFEVLNPGATVPFHHQYLIASLIESFKGDEYKDFTMYNFSGLKGKTSTLRNGLQFITNKITIVVSSQNENFLNFILQRVFQKGEIAITHLYLKPLYVEKEDEVSLRDEVKYLCISPMIITSSEERLRDSNKFISPRTDSFSDYLYESTMARMETSGLFSQEELSSFYKFQLIPDMDYLAKIESENKKFSRVYSIFEGREVHDARAYTFPFTLYAAPEVQSFLFVNGLGYFNHKGFGMLDIAESSTNRTSLYKYD